LAALRCRSAWSGFASIRNFPYAGFTSTGPVDLLERIAAWWPATAAAPLEDEPPAMNASGRTAGGRDVCSAACGFCGKKRLRSAQESLDTARRHPAEISKAAVAPTALSRCRGRSSVRRRVRAIHGPRA
jgi:hypothetical protein